MAGNPLMRRHENPIESRLLASSKDSALLALSVGDLPQSVLTQLSGIPLQGKRVFSLYSVYREGPMTFDAIIGLEVVDSTLELTEVLSHFVHGSEFRASILTPLIKTVHRHFRRAQTTGAPSAP